MQTRFIYEIVLYITKEAQKGVYLPLALSLEQATVCCWGCESYLGASEAPLVQVGWRRYESTTSCRLAGSATVKENK